MGLNKNPYQQRSWIPTHNVVAEHIYTITHGRPIFDRLICMIFKPVSVSFGQWISFWLKTSIHFIWILYYVLFRRRSSLYLDTCFHLLPFIYFKAGMQNKLETGVECIWKPVSKDLETGVRFSLDSNFSWKWMLVSEKFARSVLSSSKTR